MSRPLSVQGLFRDCSLPQGHFTVLPCITAGQGCAAGALPAPRGGDNQLNFVFPCLLTYAISVAGSPFNSSCVSSIPCKARPRYVFGLLQQAFAAAWAPLMVSAGGVSRAHGAAPTALTESAACTCSMSPVADMMVNAAGFSDWIVNRGAC
jgi:hypothetical protein